MQRVCGQTQEQVIAIRVEATLSEGKKINFTAFV